MGLARRPTIRIQRPLRINHIHTLIQSSLLIVLRGYLEPLRAYILGGSGRGRGARSGFHEALEGERRQYIIHQSRLCLLMRRKLRFAQVFLLFGSGGSRRDFRVILRSFFLLIALLLATLLIVIRMIRQPGNRGIAILIRIAAVNVLLARIQKRLCGLNQTGNFDALDRRNRRH